jgi:hypothetical protein
VRLQPVERADQVIARVAERRARLSMQRHVKMHPPLVVRP